MKIKKFKYLSMGIVIGLLLSLTTYAFAADISAKMWKVGVFLNGVKHNETCNAIFSEGDIYLPAKYFSNVFGMSYSYSDKTGMLTLNDSGKQSPQPTPSQPARTTGSYLKVGDAANFAEWDYTVLKVETHQNLSSYRTNIAKGKYVVAIVKFTNQALYEREVGTDFLVEDELGRIYSMDYYASSGYHLCFESETNWSDDIGSSFSGTVALVFDVPVGAKNIVLYPTTEFGKRPAHNSKGVLLLDVLN